MHQSMHEDPLHDWSYSPRSGSSRTTTNTAPRTDRSFTPQLTSCPPGHARPPREDGPKANEVTAFMDAPASAAAGGISKLQNLWRGHVAREEMRERLEAVVAPPSIKVSKEAQVAETPKSQDGRLLSLFCPIEVFKVFGSGVYAYMHWSRMMMVAFAIAFAFALPNTMQNMFGDQLEEPSWLTAHTLGNVSNINASYGAVELLVSLTFVITLFRGKRVIADAVAEVELDENDENDQDETVWLHGLSAKTQESQLKTALSKFGEVTRVSLAVDNRDLLLRLKARRALLEDLNYRQALHYLARHKKKPDQVAVDAHFAKSEQARNKLADHDRVTAALSRVTYDCTGDAFVTFKTAAAARECIDTIGPKKTLADLRRLQSDMQEAVVTSQVVPRPLKRAISSMTSADLHATAAQQASSRRSPLPASVWASAAPAPSDIMWEGLSTSDGDRSRRQILSTAITLSIACISTAVIAGLAYIQGDGLLDNVIQAPEGFAGIVYSLVMALAMALPCILCSVAIFATTPVLANTIERHATVSSMELMVFQKLLFFQVFNTAASAFTFLALSGGLLGRAWYPLGGSLLMTCLGPIGDCILLPFLLDWVTLDMPPRRYIFAPRQKTQLGMDRLYVKQADLYLAFRVQLGCKFVVLCLMFGTAIPMLYFCGALYFAFGMLIDRHNLLRNMTPPPHTSAILLERAHFNILPIAIILHAVMSPIFFYQLQLEEANEQAANVTANVTHAPPPLVTAPVDVEAGSVSIQAAVYMAIILSALSATVVVCFKCSTNKFIKVHVEELLAEQVKKRSARKGVATFTIRPPPRQTYAPPALSAKLLAKFGGGGGTSKRVSIGPPSPAL